MAHNSRTHTHSMFQSDQEHNSLAVDKSRHKSAIDNDKTMNNSLAQPLIQKQQTSGKTTFKKQNFKHESFKQSASVNEVDDSVDSNTYLGNLAFANSGGAMEATHGSPDIFVDEDALQSNNSQAYESLKKIKKNRQEQLRLREVSEKCFSFIENRDKHGLMRYLDKNISVNIVDVVD